MPTLHRMSCFRDDLVFFVILYQRWVYRVDMKRVNEFGHRGDGSAADDASASEGTEQKEAPVTRGGKSKKKQQ